MKRTSSSAVKCVQQIAVHASGTAQLFRNLLASSDGGSACEQRTSYTYCRKRFATFIKFYHRRVPTTVDLNACSHHSHCCVRRQKKPECCVRRAVARLSPATPSYCCSLCLHSERRLPRLARFRPTCFLARRVWKLSDGWPNVCTTLRQALLRFSTWSCKSTRPPFILFKITTIALLKIRCAKFKCGKLYVLINFFPIVSERFLRFSLS